ncbi:MULTISPECIES: PQQ-binding-like beta-propeller repeat protein [unclassified Halorubrum]|uniref:outer membrane protein assembly factor BamB family protein n=1 Tax=unclassified Halorubrum TaxID=2642239 RepID=UPI000B99A5BE|nr:MULTISPECIES: PQQ-binding-like beta-propeller repeat protein [unclassified Halorubrum]OYR43722.1 cell surface protein [Halorubrum sp. Hd13]OYR48223.1 cell surface protein [Halorubrum sp. Ea8]
MTERTRRDWLRVAGGVGVAGLAGCSALGGDPSGDGDDGDSDFEGVDLPLALDDRPQSPDGLASQFRQGLRNHGHIDATVPETVEVRWAVPANRGDHTASKGSPMLAPSGDVLVADDTGRVQSIATDGEPNWSTSISDDARGSHGTPAIADGTAYVGTYDGVVSAVSVADGEILWQTDVGDAAAASPTYHEGRLYVAVEYATPSGTVVVMDAETGDVEWRDDRPTDHPHSTVAVDLERDRFLFGSNDGHVYAWSVSDRERAWTYDTGGDVKAPIAVSRGIAVVPSWAETVTAVDVADGTGLWEFETDDMVMCAPAVHDGTVYVGSHDGNVYAIDLATGEEEWSTPVNGWVTGSVTATNGHVLAGSYDAHLYALDRADGSVTWAVEGKGDVTSAPLVTDDAVYYAERAPEDSDEAGMCYKLAAPE